MKTDTEAVAITGLRSATIRAQGLVSQRLERSLFKVADELLAVASSVAMDLSAYGIDPGKVAVAGNAVDPGEFSPEPSIVPIPVVMYCGRLSEEKGLADLVRAIALLAPNHPGLTLRLVGTGPSERDLRRLALRLKIDGRVEFAGHIPSERRGELVRMYRQAAVYVQPSHHEGMPTSLLEAMACGRPTVATAVSGHPDAIEDGTTGLLVRPRDPPSLAGAIARVLSDPFLAERLGRGARAKVLTDHTWKAVTSVYEAAFDRARANWAHRTRNVSPVQ